MEEVTNMETNTVTTNNGHNGESAAAKANSENLNSSNNDSSRSNKNEFDEIMKQCKTLEMTIRAAVLKVMEKKKKKKGTTKISNEDGIENKTTMKFKGQGQVQVKLL